MIGLWVACSLGAAGCNCEGVVPSAGQATANPAAGSVAVPSPPARPARVVPLSLLRKAEALREVERPDGGSARVGRQPFHLATPLQLRPAFRAERTVPLQMKEPVRVPGRVLLLGAKGESPGGTAAAPVHLVKLQR